MKIVRNLNLEIIKLLGFRANLKTFTRAIRKVKIESLFYLTGNFSEITCQIKISPRDRTAADM